MINKSNSDSKLLLKVLLCKGDEKIAWGNLLVTSSDCCTCFGNLYEDDFTTDEIKERQTIQLYAGLIIEHSVDENGAQILLKLYELVDSDKQYVTIEQVLKFRSAARIPFEYQSEDNDLIELVDDYVLIFQARWC